MKEYEVLVVIKMSFSIEATDKKEAIDIVKDIVLQDNNIELDDKEIVEIEEV